ncbi:hypothetical protein EV183_004725 [Coemansia sp. RSA 2336]|nr:hypothetical protein EV183_004725 [Coemansia sp. RSA 2336]
MRSANNAGGSSKGELHTGEDATLDRTHDETGDSIADSTSMIQDHEDDEDDNDDEDDANKQQRLMRACDNCRRKKVKCNGTKPSCSHCMRMKLACNYSPLVRKKRTRRSVIDKLQDRLASMEQMLQPLVERLQPNDPVVSAGVGGFGLGFGFAPAPPPTLMHPLGLPAPPKNYTSQGIPREMQNMAALPSTASDPPPPPLPPPHIVEELMEIAITRMTPTAPPVSWTRLVRRLHSGQLPEFIICATIALAARFSNRPEFSCTPRYNAGREYAKRAAELVSGLVDKPDPDVVFCLVMLSLYEWGCGRGESAWTYTGMATRLAQRCRLHLVDEEDFNENVDKQAYTWANAEWRRRLWWHVYCGDRTSVIVASRPATVHDDDCVVNLPTHDHEWLTGTVPSVDRRSAEPASLGNEAHLAGQPSSQHKSMAGNRLPDSWWLVVELYRMCSRISEFANRRRRPVRSSNIPRRQMFDILDRELEEIRSRFLPCMEFPPRTEWLLCGYANMGDGAHGMSNIYAIFFNIYLMYYAAKIILYRSELPEYQHESISPDLIERAKSVCIESAHKQADVIRWALDNVPVEEWDPKVGVWSLQGASVHVNAALVADNAIAEQSRRDLEVHLKLHVASDQYYHFNMAMVTMLHHVFNLRKQQRLAARSHNSQSEVVPNGSQIVIQHANDSDPWIVPRCSSFLGFTYNYSQLRGILNTAIKQTTYSPPDAITEGGDLPPDDSQAGYPQSTSSLQSAAQATPISISNSVPQSDAHRQQSASFNVDLSGGLWSLPSNLDSASLAKAMSAFPEMAKLASLQLDTASSNDTNPPLSATSAGVSSEEALKSTKRSYSSSSGPGNRKASAGKLKADGTTEAQQQQQLQRLEDLRARVILLQQLSGKQNGPADALSGNPATSPAAAQQMDSQTAAGSQDVNGFLSNFAESIGSVASQLGSSSGPTMPWSKSEPPAHASVPSNGGSQQMGTSNAGLAAAYGQQQGLINDAWLAGSSSAMDFSAISASLAGASSSISNEDLQRIAAQASLAGQAAATSGYNPGAQQAADYSVEGIHGLIHNPAAFHPADSDPL